VTNQFVSQLSLGDEGNEVANLQLYLDYLSVYYSTIPTVSVDGIFGVETQNAVSAAQRNFGLPITGVVDAATWEAIYRAYLGIIGTVPPEFTEGAPLP
jgi:peptidoglycan hydrolase-like protein with peptidoglycan-binding domain